MNDLAKYRILPIVIALGLGFFSAEWVASILGMALLGCCFADWSIPPEAEGDMKSIAIGYAMIASASLIISAISYGIGKLLGLMFL